MDSKVKFLRGTATEYTASTKDNDTFYYTTNTKKLYLGETEITGIEIDDTSTTATDKTWSAKKISDSIPTELPADGGNADTLDGLHASDIQIDSVSDTAELVTLDGLQGGVPFSEITVSGKNLLKYPYAQTTNTNHGVTFTDNGDGSITASGTHDGGTELSYFGFSPWWSNSGNARLFLPKGNTVTFRVLGLPDTYQCVLSVKKDNTSTNGITARYGVGEAAAKYTAEKRKMNQAAGFFR